MNRAPSEYRYLRTFVLLTLGVGTARLILTLAGVRNESVRFASMTTVILAGIVWYGSRPTAWRSRLWISYALILPYMLIETVALGLTLVYGIPTIFQAPEYSMGTPIRTHFLGHVVGGLTWEPFGVFVILTALSWVFRLARRNGSSSSGLC
jgi:hypothetical protein